MNEERLSGLGMLHNGTDYIPGPGVTYQMKKTGGSEQAWLRFNLVPWVSIYIVNSKP